MIISNDRTLFSFSTVPSIQPSIYGRIWNIGNGGQLQVGHSLVTVYYCPCLSQRFPLSSLPYMGGYGILAMGGAASSGALPSHRLLFSLSLVPSIQPSITRIPSLPVQSTLPRSRHFHNTHVSKIGRSHTSHDHVV